MCHRFWCSIWDRRIARFRLDVSGTRGANVADGDDGWRVQRERRFHRLPETRSASISDIGGFFFAVAGGFIGAGLGFWYGETQYPDGVRNVRFVFSPSLKTPPVFAFINGATLGSTLSGGVYYALRLWRFREI